MKSILTFFFALLAFSVIAQFVGNYAPANWTETHSSLCDNGFVDLNYYSSASEILIVGSNNPGCGGSVFGYSIPLTACGTITFNWLYTGWDGRVPSCDRFGYSVNGIAYQLTNDFAGTLQYGSASANVSIGDVFSFYIYSTDNANDFAYCDIWGFYGVSIACQNGNKELMCHNGNTICIAPEAVPAHLAHGDYLGECGTPGCAPQQGGNGLQSIVNALDPEADKEGKGTQIISSMTNLEQLLAKETAKNESKMIDVYPNPASNVINILVNAGILGPTNIYFYNQIGQLVLSTKADITIGVPVQLNTGNLLDGNYNIRLETQNGVNSNKTVIISN